MIARRNGQRAVSASALSQMGVCERLVVFEYHEGKRLTLARKVAMQRGLRAHRRFASMGSVDVSRRGHCFISTRAVSDRTELGVLRGCGDEILRPAHPVWRLILRYYQVALRVCRAPARRPVLQYVARAVRRAVMRVAARALGALGVGRVD